MKKSLKLDIEGIHCKGCEALVKGDVSELKNVLDVRADHVCGKVVIDYQNSLDFDLITDVILKLGFEVKNEMGC